MVLLVAALGAAPGPPAAAQQTPATGVVHGRVVDRSGQVVDGARVVVDLVGSADSRYETITNDDGQYRQDGLATGQYTVTAEKDSLGGDVFRVVVRPGRAVEVNFELEPGRRVATWLEELEGREMLTKLFAEGVAANRAGNYQQALDRFQAALELMPICVDCHFNVGVAYGRLADFANAEAAFKRAVEIRPDYAAAYYGLADLYLRQQRPADAAAARGEANRIALQALAAGRVRAEETLRQGISFFEAGSFFDAQRRFEEALRQDANLVDARYWLAMAHLRQDSAEAAAREFGIYLQLASDGQFAERAREELQKLSR